MREVRKAAAAAAAVLFTLSAVPAQAATPASPSPFGVAPLSDTSLAQVVGRVAPERNRLYRMTRDQAADLDRWTGSVGVQLLSAWTNDVALPLIATNIVRPEPLR